MARRLTQEQRGKFAEKIMDWGNIVFAGLVIAQIVPGVASFRSSVAVFGVMNLLGAYLLAYAIMKGVKE